MPKPIEFRMNRFPPTLALLSKVEQVIGVPLPHELRDHFMKHNGGDPSRATTTVSGKPVSKYEDYLSLSFNSLHVASVFSPLECEYTVLSLAFDGQHSYNYVLGPKDQGAIAYCYGRAREKCRFVRIVSQSFGDFLDTLETDPVEGWKRYGRGDTPIDKTYIDFVPYQPDQATLELRRGPPLTRQLNFVDCLPPVTDDHFAWMEQGFQIRVPLDIREHFQRFNGGKPAYYLHYRFEGQMCQFNNFYSMQYPNPMGTRGLTVGLGEFEDRCVDLKWREKFIPAHLFPIAIAYDELCFSSREEDFGSIWTWTHNIYEQGFKKIADSFNEFLNSLQDAP